MSDSEYTFGEAKEVRMMLMTANSVSHEELVGALANAMKRIHDLENKHEAMCKEIQRLNIDVLRGE